MNRCLTALLIASMGYRSSIGVVVRCRALRNAWNALASWLFVVVFVQPFVARYVLHCREISLVSSF